MIKKEKISIRQIFLKTVISVYDKLKLVYAEVIRMLARESIKRIQGILQTTNEEYVKRFISIFLGTKALITDKNKWYDIIKNQRSFLDAIVGLGNSTNLVIFNDNEMLEVIDKLANDQYFQVMELLEVLFKNLEPIPAVKELRDLNNVLNKSFSNYNTSESILKIPTKIFDISENNTVVDYFCGQSGVITSIYEEAITKGVNANEIKYFAQEIDPSSFYIGQLVGYILLKDNSEVVLGDSLEHPSFIEQGELKKFDYAISVPPLGLRFKDYIVKNDRFNRFTFGLAGKNIISSEWAIIQQQIASINDTGRAGILMPIAALSRSGSEEIVRRNIVLEDLIESIIKLPSNILEYTSIPVCWVIVNRNKSINSKGKVQFIDLSKYQEKIDRKTLVISKYGIDLAEKLYKDFSCLEEVSFIVDNNFIIDHESNLNGFELIKIKELHEKISDFNMIELSEVTKRIRRGVQVTKGKLDELNNSDERTHYLINIGNITEGKIVVNEEDKVKIEDRWKDLYEVQPGDILLTSKGSLIKIAIVKEDLGKAIVSSNLFVIRVDRKKYKPEALKYYFESELGQKMLKGIQQGSVIMSIAAKDLENLLVPNIDMDTQIKATELLDDALNEYKRQLEFAKNIYEAKLGEVNKLLKLEVNL